MVSWRTGLLIGALAGVFLTVAIALLFQDRITLFAMNPRTPFQTDRPPPPPAYGARGAWALWPDDGAAGKADIFYIHSSTFTSNDRWNAPLTHSAADSVLRRIAAPNEAGPFLRIGAVYGPRYRQATLYAAFTHKFDGLAAHQLAYRDVEKAFLHFLEERQQDRPLILVGYGQGGLHALGLLQFQITPNELLRKNLAAAYIIGHGAPMAEFENALSATPPCTSPEDIRCVISYIDLEGGFEPEETRFRRRTLVWRQGERLTSARNPDNLCINPLNWTMTTEKVSAENHLGAASATGLRMRETPPPIASATSAQCQDGILAVDSPRQSFLRRNHWFGSHWRAQPYNLFYHDLAADAERRIDILNATLSSEAVDLSPSP